MNLTLMRLIDRQFLETPFSAVQQMTSHLQNEGHAVNVKRIRRLRRLMPIYQKTNTGKPAKGHKGAGRQMRTSLRITRGRFLYSA